MYFDEDHEFTMDDEMIGAVLNFECKAIGVENPVWYFGYPVKEESKYFLFNGHKKIEVREETICRMTS